MIAACFALRAALLWLVAELAAAAGAKPPRVARAVFAASVVLGACALWWPANALRVPGGAARGWPAVALAVAAVPGARGPGGCCRRALEPGAARGRRARRCRVADRRRIARALRAGGAPLAAAVACIGVAISVPASDAQRWVAGPEWLVITGLAALAAVLLMVMQQTAVADARGRPTRAAAVDNLTGLPTRLHFESRLQAAAKECNAGSTQLAVRFIDLDGFKPVNDTFGHSSGDRVLEQVGQRLKTFARGAGVVARVGGDEFLLLATGIAQESVARLVTRLIDALIQPYKIDGRAAALARCGRLPRARQAIA